jgi:hypothetical protein
VQPTQNLPENYQLAGTIDLSKDRKLFLVLNLAAVILFLVSGWLFIGYLRLIRPEETGGQFQSVTFTLGSSLMGVLWILLGTAAMLIVHEAIHGVFFWLYTHSRPRFGFRGAYAFAAAPDWFIPRNRYLWIGLSPLVVISLVGLVLLAVVPPSWFGFLLIILVFNASGAIGDIMVVAWLLRKPSSTLAQDQGDSVSAYLVE